ncbi:thioredoxin family protein [Akkermansiaceae bacterium]|nr:thioredoxin family protein [Akkermansiaceae bacterium]
MIKKLAITLISTASIGIASAGDFKTDFEAAKAEAAKTQKAMLVIFTGSDWCPPCKALHKNIFSKEEFVKGAEKDFVIVELDYPRNKEQSAELKKQNIELAKKYKIRGYPTVLLMDAKGKVFKTADRPNTVKAYLEMLKTSLKARRFL